MTPFRTLIHQGLLLAGVAAIAVAFPAATTSAGGSAPGWLTVPGGQPLFDLSNIAPGGAGSATLTVANPEAFPVKFSLAVISITDDDNGCNEPEVASGDVTCGPGGGELQSDLRISLAATGATDRPIFADTLDVWPANAAVDPVTLTGYEVRTYRVGYELPTGTSNVTQSDLVAFQFELRLDQVGGIAASEPPPAVLPATAALPRTGGSVRNATILGVWAMATGLGLYRISTRRRRAS